MGQISLKNSNGAGFYGYADNNTTYGYYNVTFNYSTIVRHGKNITVTDAYIEMKNPNTGYTTNYVYVDKVTINTIDVGISGNAYGGTSNHTWKTSAKDVSFTVNSDSARVITVKMWGHRTGQVDSNGNIIYQTLSGTFEIPPIYVLTINPNGGKINNGDTTGQTTSFTTKFLYGVKTYMGNLTSANTVVDNTPTRTGYTFNNFTFNHGSGGLNSSGDTFYFNGEGPGAGYGNLNYVYVFNGDYIGNVTATAQWIANTYTVKYNGNGSTGGSTTNSTHTYDTSKTLTSNGFTKTGYTFKNWNTKADGSGTSYSNGASVKNLTTTNGGTVNLYAQWTPNKIKLTLNPNGGTGGTQNIWYYYGTSTFYSNEACTATIKAIDRPTRTDYAFVHYYGDGTSGGVNGERYIAYDGTEFASDLATDIYKDATLYAQWIAVYYLDLNTYINGVNNTTEAAITADVYIGGSKVASGVSDYWTQHPTGTTYEIKNINVKSGFTKLNVTGASGTLNSTKECIVYVGRNYTVTYKANGGTGSDQTQAINYGTAWTTKSSTTFSRTGYTLSGWNTAANGSGASYGLNTAQSTTTNSNITLYAQWTANTGSLFFNANYNSIEQNLLDFTKFTNGTQNNINYSYDATTGILTLNGTSNNGQIQTICWLDCNIPTDTYYTISGEVVGGSMENGRFVIEMPVASGAGRQRLDLFNTSYGVSFLSNTNINSIRLWAWQDGSSGILKFNNYKIKLKIELGIHYEDFIWTPNKKTVSYNSSYGSLVNITRPGYKFNGWYTASSGGTKVTSSTTQTTTGNTILYAQWTPYKITINYFANGATYGTYYGNELDLTKQIHTQTFTYDVQNSNGLNNINNKDSLYLEKLGYRPVPNKQWNTKSDGTGININHNTGYNGQTLAAHLGLSIDTGNVSQNVYANWEPWGVVKIYTNNGWKLAVPYIYDNGWKQTFPYIYDNGWKECH